MLRVDKSSNKALHKKKLEFKSIGFTALEAATRKPQKMLLEPLIKEGEAVMIYAASGLGKSFYSMGLAVAMATGTEFIGYQAPKALRVKYIDGEMSKYDLMTRIQANIGNRCSNNQFMKSLNSNLLISNRELCTSQNVDYPDIGNESHIDIVIDELVREKVEVVVFDNYSTLALGIEDENSAGSFNITLELVMRLKALGIVPIVVHHANKTGKAYRGTTKIEAVFSSIIGLHRDSSVDVALGAGFTIKFDKNRSSYNPLLETRTVQCLQQEEPVWVEVESEAAKYIEVIEALRTLEFTSQEALADSLGITQGAVSKRIKKAIANDYINKQKVDELWELAKQEVADSEPDF